MLTYEDVARELRLKEGTLRRQILEFNAQTRECDQVKPDLVEEHGHYVKHFFNASSIAKIQAALKALSNQPKKKRGWPKGRPRKTKASGA